MTTLYESDIAQTYIGKPCNKQRYSETFNKGNYFFPSLCDIQTKWKFNITPALYLGWEQRNIDFQIIAEIEDGVISYCYISKRKENYSGLYVRNPCVSLKPTQQELKLFKRVMEYVTE